MRFCELCRFRSGPTITCALATVIMSRVQFLGWLTHPCMCTIAYCIQVFYESSTKEKNKARTQKSLLQTMASTVEAYVLIHCFRTVSCKNKTTILEQKGVFSMFFIQNICHVVQAEEV